MLCSSFATSLFFLFSFWGQYLRRFSHRVIPMAKEEGSPIASDVEATNESLSPLQDPWYFFSPLFPVVPTDLSPPNAPSQWNIRGEAPSLETAWVPAASEVIDLGL